MVHEDFKEMLGAHALSALDLGEARFLEDHLVMCQSCRSDLDGWLSTAAALAFAGDVVEPSPQLRERILDQVRQERTTVNRTAPADGTSGESAGPTKVLAFESTRRRNIWASIGTLGAIAAVIVFAALIISLIVLWRENRITQGELARLSSQMKLTESQLQRAQEAVVLVTTPGAQLTELSATKVAPGAHATLAYDKNGKAMLLANGLPAAPPGKAYQLWFIVGNKPLPGKVFNTDATGTGDLTDVIPSAALNGAIFAITQEPETGVRAPTGDIFLKSGS
jgi:hypothetical protein